MPWRISIDPEREEKYLGLAKDFIDLTPVGNRNSQVFSKNGRLNGLPGVWPDSMTYLTINKIAPDFDRDKGLYLFRQNSIYPTSRIGTAQDFLAYLVMDGEEYKDFEKKITDTTPIDSRGFMNRFITSDDNYDFSLRNIDCRIPLILAYTSGNGREGYIGGEVKPSSSVKIGEDHYGRAQYAFTHWTTYEFNPDKVKELMLSAKRKAVGIVS